MISPILCFTSATGATMLAQTGNVRTTSVDVSVAGLPDQLRDCLEIVAEPEWGQESRVRPEAGGASVRVPVSVSALGTQIRVHLVPRSEPTRQGATTPDCWTQYTTQVASYAVPADYVLSAQSTQALSCTFSFSPAVQLRARVRLPDASETRLGGFYSEWGLGVYPAAPDAAESEFVLPGLPRAAPSCVWIGIDFRAAGWASQLVPLRIEPAQAAAGGRLPDLHVSWPKESARLSLTVTAIESGERSQDIRGAVVFLVPDSRDAVWMIELVSERPDQRTSAPAKPRRLPARAQADLAVPVGKFAVVMASRPSPAGIARLCSSLLDAGTDLRPFQQIETQSHAHADLRVAPQVVSNIWTGAPGGALMPMQMPMRPTNLNDAELQ